MGSFEVVLNEPLGHLAVEAVRVGGAVPHLQELASERSVEAFVEGIVRGRVVPAPPVAAGGSTLRVRSPLPSGT